MPAESGFEEVDHTADWALHVWAPDLAELLRTTARGMYALMGIRTDPQSAVPCTVDSAGIDAESLLVAFLAELLRISEEDGLALADFSISLDGFHLAAAAAGHPITAQQKEIKAVTFHDLAIVETAHGLETTIVFDV